jgi:hypothetical protein
VDDVLSRIEERLLMLRCNPRTDTEEVLIECIGALVEEVRRLRTGAADSSSPDPERKS